MRLAILNYTGTVGKTTIAAHMLSPRLGNAPIIAVESINQTAASLGVAVEQMAGDKFWEQFKTLLAKDSVIVDVGTSNIESFLAGMAQFEESHLEFDYFIVPVTHGTKEQRETVTMVGTLADLGIRAEKIRLLFNRASTGVVEDEYPIILEYVKKHMNANTNPKAVVFENELFDALAVKMMPIDKLLEDPEDYKAMLRDNKDADANLRAYWADMFSLKALAKGVNRNLDDAYAALFS
jgi:hypothetical protein